jgi:hypothetical protein
MRKLITAFFLIITVYTAAQQESAELITDRPDQTESSTVVPHKSLQIETGFVLENTDNDMINTKSFAYNSTLLRYGLRENFELRLGLEYLGEEIKNKLSDSTNKFSGLSPLYLGFKVKIAEEDGVKPEIAFLGGLVLPFSAEEYFKPSYSAANIRFSFSHTLSERFSLGYNLGAEWDGESPVPGYFYSFVLGAGLTEKTGIFLESFGLLPEEGDAEHLLDGGITYLLLPNLQLDLSGGIGLQNTIDNFISFGLTYRLPK